MTGQVSAPLYSLKAAPFPVSGATIPRASPLDLRLCGIAKDASDAANVWRFASMGLYLTGISAPPAAAAQRYAMQSPGNL